MLVSDIQCPALMEKRVVPWRHEGYSFPELASFPVLGSGQSVTAVMEKAKCGERTKGAYDSVWNGAGR